MASRSRVPPPASAPPTDQDDKDESNNSAVSSRRLKKRELDRRCQRMARERTKARIAHLEELVDNFRRQDDNERVATLMEQLEEVSKERDTLAKTLDNIRSLIGDNRRSDVQDAKHEEHKDTAEARGEEQPPQPLHQRTSVGNASVMSMPASHQPQSGWSAFPTTQHRHDSDVSTIDYSQRAPASSVWSLDMSGDSDYISSFGDLPQTSAPRLVHSDSLLAPDQLSGPIVPQPSQCCECSTPKQPFQPGTTPNKWRIANEVLIQRSRLQPAVQRLEDNMSDDTPVRALVEGWDAVDKRGPLSASWQLMRGIDQSLCFSMGFIERLAIMKIMHTLLLYHCDPSPERLAKVPPWYLKRPCQETIPHSYAIDFFAWPGLRERFIFHQHRYCTNTFWRFFCTSLHVLWSGGLHDTFTHSTQTGLYTISQPFIDRISDLSSWTMSNEIFQHFPELYSDIPVFNSIPGSLAPNVPHQLITAATAPAAGRHITKGVATTSRNDQARQQPYVSGHNFDHWGEGTMQHGFWQPTVQPPNSSMAAANLAKMHGLGLPFGLSTGTPEGEI